MARPLRVNITDGWYHVMHRGIERRTIFDGQREHERFLELLGDVHERYRGDTKQILTRGTDEARLERFRDVVGIGSVQFVDRVRRLAGEGERETERRGRLRTSVSYEDVVHVVENVWGEKQQGWLNKHGDWGKWLVLRLARQYCGLSLSELGQQVGDKDYAAVSMGLRRFDDRMAADRKLQKLYEQSKEMLNV